MFSELGWERWIRRVGEGQGEEMAWWIKRGPPMVIMLPNVILLLLLLPEVSLFPLEEEEDEGGSSIISRGRAFQVARADSRASEPPWANPKRWILESGQPQMVVRWEMVVVRTVTPGAGFGCTMGSPRSSKEGYHW